MRAVGATRVELPLEQQPQIHGIGVARPRQAVQRYRLMDLWSLLVPRYAMLASLDGETFRIRPGHLLLMPPGLGKLYQVPETGCRHLFVHFRYPAQTPTTPLPLVTDSGGDYPAIDRGLSEAVGLARHQPLRAEIRLWDLLHRLTDALGDDPGPETVHPAVIALEAEIERHLDTPLTVAALARAVGLSHGHLSTLYRRSRGETIVAYIRRRRLERARHLLIHSTAAVADIASEVGLGDLQSFNKALRKQFGCGPRELRRRAGHLAT